MPCASNGLIRRESDEYVINGRQWFITNAAHPNCKFMIVMGKADPDGDAKREQSMVIVPMHTSGVKMVRNIAVMNHITPEGRCELLRGDVRSVSQ